MCSWLKDQQGLTPVNMFIPARRYNVFVALPSGLMTWAMCALALTMAPPRPLASVPYKNKLVLVIVAIVDSMRPQQELNNRVVERVHPRCMRKSQKGR
jgi:hypothetical protein